LKFECAHDELVDVHKLQPNPKNPNTHPARQIELLAKIIDYQGQRSPIVVSKRSGFITKGHGRLDAIKRLGWEKAAVDYQDYADEAQEYADMVADNKIAELAEHDDNAMIEGIKTLGITDLELLGLDGFELPAEPVEAQCDEDEVPSVRTDTIAKPGDVWILGDHRLMCGDSTNIQHVERLMDGVKAEMLFTDPPYGVDYSGGIQFKDGVAIKESRTRLAGDDSTNLYRDVAPIIGSYVDGPCYVWFAFSKAKDTIDAIDAIGEIHALIIWHKTNATYGALNANYKQRHEPCIYLKTKGSTLRWAGPTDECTVWEMKRDPRNDMHPTQKPVELAERAISNHDASTVLDLFGGSGSTLIACEKTNRKCYMMELDPKYCDVILARWEKYTGKKAELVTNG
jgi:DNA modification methylase